MLRKILTSGLALLSATLVSGCGFSEGARAGAVEAGGRVASYFVVDSEHWVFNREIIADVYVSDVEVAGKNFREARFKITNDTRVIQEVGAGTAATTFRAFKPGANVRALVVGLMPGDGSVEVDATAVEVTILR